MTESSSTPERQVSIEDRILATEVMDPETALSLGLAFFEENIKTPKLTNPLIKDTDLGLALEQVLREIEVDERETLGAAQNGDTRNLSKELQAWGKGMIRGGLIGPATPDKIKETTLGVRIYEIGMEISQKPQNPSGSQSTA